MIIGREQRRETRKEECVKHLKRLDISAKVTRRGIMECLSVNG
jgi:hypothetical protein